jgi:hypothetical protein
VTSPFESEPEKPLAHRVLWVITWILFGLGMLEWFVLGANRPVDPVLSPTVGLILPLVGHRLVR